jgi:hypothetical protein
LPTRDRLIENLSNPLWPYGGLVFDPDLVRKLCREIVQESEPEKITDLLSLLHAVIKDDQEEVRLRASFLGRKYGAAFHDVEDPVEDETPRKPVVATCGSSGEDGRLAPPAAAKL